MTDDELNAKYIQETTGLKAGDKLIPKILSMIKEAYKSGLIQGEIDNTMGLIEENSVLQYKINKAIECLNHMIEELDKRDMLHPGETELLSILQDEEVK